MEDGMGLGVRGMSILGKISVYGNVKHFAIVASSCLMGEDIMSTIFMMIDS